MLSKIQFRRGTQAQWNAANPVLDAGEPGLETDTDKIKVGDGIRHWTALPYVDQQDTQAAFQFSNSNGVSFGTNGSIVTASVQTNYQSSGAYLTTGMASNRGSDFVQATALFAGTNASGTIASGGISISVAPGGGGGGGSINVSAGETSNNLSAITFSNSNGVTFGLSNSTITASVATNYQSQGAYLTTAALSQDSSKYQTTGAYLTTAGLSQDSSKYAGTAGAITGGSITVNTSGVSVNLPAYLTTAMQSNAATISNVRVSAGASSSNVSAITFSNANGVSFGYDGTNVTATVATNYQSQAAYLTTAALSQDSSKYAGTSTGIAGGSVTLNTSGISISLPAYLTTAALSQDSSKYAGTSTGITGGSVTLNTSGIAINLPAYLTTAALSGDTSKYAGINSGATNCSVTVNTSGVSVNVPAAAAQSNQTVGLYASSNTYLTSSGTQDARSLSFRGDKSITVGISSGEVLFSVGAYLTTAALSGDTSKYAGINSGATNCSVTVNTSGVSVNLPAYLTTAALSADSSKYAGINSGATNCSVTVNTSGVSVNLPAYLTTADLSANSSAYLQRWDLLGANTAGTTTSASLSRLQLSAENGITLSGNSNTIRISIGAYLTTAALSGDTSKYAGINSGATNCSVTVNTSGVSVNLPAYLTTAALSADSSKYAGTSTGMTGGSVTLNTSGIAINLPAYLTTAMLSNAATISNVFISAGTTSTSASAFTFSNSNAISFGLGTGASAGVITASVATVSVISFSAGTSSQTFGSLVFSNSNGISFGLNGSTVTAQGPFISYLNLAPFWFNTVTSSFAQSTSHMIPFVAPEAMSIGSVRMFEVGTMAASSTQGLVNGSTLSMSGQTTHNFVFYSRGVGASSMSLQYVTSTQVVDNVVMSVQNAAGANSSQVSYTYRFSLGNTSFTKDYSSTAQSYNFHTSNVTDLTGTKQVDYPCGLTLSQGQWFLGYGRSTTFATQNAVISVATRLNISYDSQFIVSQNTLGAIGTLGGASSSSIMFGPVGLGSYSTGGAAGTTNSLNISVISSGSSNQMPLLQLIRIA